VANSTRPLLSVTLIKARDMGCMGFLRLRYISASYLQGTIW
jgi:hypothetical protein